MVLFSEALQHLTHHGNFIARHYVRVTGVRGNCASLRNVANECRNYPSLLVSNNVFCSSYTETLTAVYKNRSWQNFSDNVHHANVLSQLGSTGFTMRYLNGMIRWKSDTPFSGIIIRF